MEEIDRQQFNRIAHNYEHVYYQISKHIILPQLDICRRVFSVERIIKMFEGTYHSIKRDSLHLGDITTYKDYTNIVIAIECQACAGDKELPWEEDRLPPKDFLLAMLKTLEPGHEIFSENPNDLLGVDESKIQLKKETIELLQKNPPLNPYRACIKKRTDQERKQIKIKMVQRKKQKIENALAQKERSLNFKKVQIQKLQQRENQLGQNQNQQNQMLED